MSFSFRRPSITSTLDLSSPSDSIGLNLADTDDSSFFKNRNKVRKSKKNKNKKKQDFNRAVRSGGKTSMVIALESKVKELEESVNIKNKQIQIRQEKERLDSIFDRLGNIPPNQLMTEKGFRLVKSSFPQLSKKDFINKFAPFLYKRKKATLDLSKLPEGADLDQVSQESLFETGIGNPSKFMSISKKNEGGFLKKAGRVAGKVLQSVSDAALDTGKAGVGGDFNPFFSAGQAELRKEKLDAEEREFSSTQKLKEDKLFFDRSFKNEEFKLRKEKINFEKINKKLDIANKKGLREDVLRKEYAPIIKRFNQVRVSNLKVIESIKLNTAIGDIAAIFAYLKVVDPGSTIREAEAEAIEKARGIDDKTKNLFKKVVEGTRFSDQQRRNMIESSQQLFKVERRFFNEEAFRIKDVAENRNLDFTNIFGRAGIPSAAEDTLPLDRSRKQISLFGKRFLFSGTDPSRDSLINDFNSLQDTLKEMLDDGRVPEENRKAAENKIMGHLLEKYKNVLEFNANKQF